MLTVGLSACGGSGSDGGSDGGNAVLTSTLSGTAATGAAIKGKVFAKDANGVEVEIATGLNGSFTLNTTGMTPPFLLKIVPDDGSEILYSYALANNQTVNITPLTNLAVFLANNKADMAAVYGNWAGTAISAAAIAEAAAIVTANFKVQITAALGSVPNYNILTEQFNADGTGIDAVMDDLIVTIDPVAASVTVTDANSVAVSFIENLDIQSPVVIAPSDITVVATSSSGIAASNSTVVAFISAATGSDNVGVVGAITNNAPAVFPAGSTQVTFTATDARGNTGTASATVVVTPFVTATPTIISNSPVNNDVFTAASNGLADVQIDVTISNFDLANGAWSMIIDGATPGAAFSSTSTTKSFSVGTHSIVFQLTGPGKSYTPLAVQNTDSVSFTVTAAPIASFNIKGAITGSVGTWELRTNNNGFVNDGSVSTNANVTFGSIQDGSTYAVTASDSTCSVSNGTGTVTGADITNVNITCTPVVVSNDLIVRVNSAFGQIVYGNGKFVTIGNSKAFSSIDGKTWTESATLSKPYNQLIFDGTQFVAMQANAAQIATSPDGTTWTSSVNLSLLTATKIAGKNGKYIAVATNKALTSTDLSTWTVVNLASASVPRAIAYNGSIAVVVGSSGLDYSTDDGSTWTEAMSPVSSNTYTNVIWDGQQFIVVGNGIMLTSPDGKSWISKVSASKYGQTFNIAFSNNVYVLTAGANIFVGSNLNALQKIEVSTLDSGNAPLMYQVAVNGDNFALTGTSLISGKPIIPAVPTPTADAWKLIMPKQTFYDLDRVVWTGSQFIAGGEFSTTLVSSDGLTWKKPIEKGTVGLISSSIMSNLAEGNGAILAMNTKTNVNSTDGGDYMDNFKPNINVSDLIFHNGLFYGHNGGKAYSSSNGAFWTEVNESIYTVALVATKGSKTLVTDGSGQFIRRHPSASGAIQTSVDSTNWTTVSAFNGGYSGTNIGLLYDGNEFLLFSETGGVYTTSDGGSSWTVKSSLKVADIAFDGTNYVAVGSQGLIYKGTNLTSMALASGGVDFVISDIVNTGSKLVAVGKRNNGTQGAIKVSTDNGVTWTEKTIPTSGYAAGFSGSSSGNTEALTSIEWDGTTFVAVGNLVNVLDNNGNTISTGGSNVQNSMFVLTSQDAETWTFKDSGHSFGIYMRATGLTFVLDRFIAYLHSSAGTPTLLQSTDAGTTWTDITSSLASSLSEAASSLSVQFIHDANQFVAGTSSGKIFTSSDFVTWVQGTSTPNNGITALTYTGANYFVTTSSTIYKSADLITWSTVLNTSTSFFQDIDYIANQLVAVKSTTSSFSFLNVYRSSDQQSWVNTEIPVNDLGWTQVFKLNNKPAVRSGNVIMQYTQ